MARRELGPATLAAVQAVEAALSPDDRFLLVACSGGPDSLALAVAARHVARRRNLGLAAVVVDHGLQTDSAAVAVRTRDQLTRLGYLDRLVVPVAVPTSAAGPEAAAREARYRALEHEAASREAAVLLGHTLDDQAETVLLGLARGSGARSLAGMPVRRGRLVRPLL
ncbi:MAG: tRNA lysidine(34) synthetase TilS, partial [Actinomycetes bacterium]